MPERVTVDCATGEAGREKLTAADVADIAQMAAMRSGERERADRLAALRVKGAAAMTPAERNEVIDLLLWGAE